MPFNTVSSPRSGGQVECAKNLNIGTSTLSRWESQYRDNSEGYPNQRFRQLFPLMNKGNCTSKGNSVMLRMLLMS